VAGKESVSSYHEKVRALKYSNQADFEETAELVGSADLTDGGAKDGGVTAHHYHHMSLVASGNDEDTDRIANCIAGEHPDAEGEHEHIHHHWHHYVDEDEEQLKEKAKMKEEAERDAETLSHLYRASIADDAVLEAWIKDEKEKMIHHHHHLEEQKFLSKKAFGDDFQQSFYK
jgi:hypothetical protein